MMLTLMLLAALGTPEQNVERAVEFLAREVPAWHADNQCYGCNSHTDTDHCQLRIGTTLSRVVTSAL